MTIISRRALLGASGAVLATPALAAWPEAGHGMPGEGADTPHICLGPIADAEINPAGIRRYTQIGLTHIILNGAGYPWNGDALKAKVKTLADHGLKAGDIGLPWSGPAGGGMRDIIYARPGRDKAIEDVKTSIRAASAAGIPIVEYNFYVHRANEAYYDHPDPSRGDAGVEFGGLCAHAGGQADRRRGGAGRRDHLGQSQIFPGCAGAGGGSVQRAPGAASQRSAGAGQRRIGPRSCPPWRAGSGWPISQSPANCIIFDCGVTRELGENPVEVARYFGQRDQIGHVHYRNVRLRVPRQDYTEVYPDNGDNNMLAVMKALVAAKYKYMIFPEHARGLDVDRDLKTNRLRPGPITPPMRGRCCRSR